MKIIYDSNKNLSNLQKHGLSLAVASLLEWDCAWVFEDNRFDYGECRMIGYVPIDSRLYCVVYVDRGELRRIISLRKANKREVIAYATNY